MDKYTESFIKKYNIQIDNNLDDFKKINLSEDKLWIWMKDYKIDKYNSNITDIEYNEKEKSIKYFFNSSDIADKFADDCELGFLKYIRMKIAEEKKDPKNYDLNFVTVVSHDPGTKVVNYKLV